jgi:regulatory protein
LKSSDNINYSFKEALSILTRICSREEKCIADIKKKLTDWNVSEADSLKIIETLVKEKYINEQRYTTSFVNDKIRFNKWGRIKIRYALKQKSIPEGIIAEAFEQVDEDKYRQILTNEISKKLKSLKKDNPYVLQNKIYRFAASRGFESDLISDITRNLISDID